MGTHPTKRLLCIAGFHTEFFGGGGKKHVNRATPSRRGGGGGGGVMLPQEILEIYMF